MKIKRTEDGKVYQNILPRQFQTHLQNSNIINYMDKTKEKKR